MSGLSVQITGGYWGERLAINRGQAIFHQWEQLEQTGCIENFRLAAGLTTGFRQGFFFSDSDAYKWLEAASQVLRFSPEPRLCKLVDDFVGLLESAQTADGYLYTYNQLHFPGRRWVNLQLEHELYCHGHLIEAGVAHQRAFDASRLLLVARRAADLIVRELRDAPPAATDGHEEIEIALLRLYRETGQADYLETARRFLERRGRVGSYARLFARQALSSATRMRSVAGAREHYRRRHPARSESALPPRNPQRVPLSTWPRLVSSLLTGRYNQQNAPIRFQEAPVGHAVRFTYLATAITMLARETGDATLAPALLRAWERMVTRRMYVTGGLGSLPLIEGFGRDDELDPEIAYAETCAALGSLFWNRELARLTNEARYDDLFEWQLYNAALPGMGVDGRAYLYNNPLVTHGLVARRSWYDVPCCPSNLSRTIAALGDHLYSQAESEIRIHQFASSRADFDLGGGVRIDQESALPWSGDLRLTIGLTRPLSFRLCLRRPAWASAFSARLNGDEIALEAEALMHAPPRTASGVSPHRATWLHLSRRWRHGDTVEIRFGMPIRLLRQAPQLPRCGGQVAVTRGPVVYCLEDLDNPLDIHAASLDPAGLEPLHDPGLLGGVTLIRGRAVGGAPLTFLPYWLWGNRGDSQMSVFVRTGG